MSTRKNLSNRITGPYQGNPWDRQTNYAETSPAYEAFDAYRNLGANRSVDRAAQVVGKTSATLKIWSSQFGWVDRAGLWDDHLVGLRAAELEQQAVDMARRHAQIGLILQARGVEGLQAKSDVQVAAFAPGDLVRLVEAGIRAEREAKGLPGQVVGQDVRVEGVGPGVLARRVLASPVATEKALELLDVLADVSAVPIDTEG